MNAPNDDPPESLIPDQSTPEAVRAAWVAAVAARDPDALRPLLTDDYEAWSHGMPPFAGVDAAVNAMRGALERYDIVQSFEPIESIISGDWAFERGTDRMTVTPLDGGPPRSQAHRAILILRRGADGRWRYARGMTNGFPAAPP